MQKRRNDVKARTTLLLALPDEHQLRFSKYETAKELWEAILKTFSGNEATKKTKKNQLKQEYSNFKAKGSETLKQTFNRLQAILSHLEFMDVEIEQDDLNQKFLTSLALEWIIGKGEVHTASIPTASIQVSTASTDVTAVSLSHDTVCAYIASQSNGSQIKYEDITQIAEDDIEEIAPRSQDRGKRESYKQGPKEEEPTPKALMAIDGIGWADDEVPTEFALMAKSNSSSKNKVEARLVEFKEHEIKFCEKIRCLERDVEMRDNKIEYLINELEQVKKEKEGLDNKLTGFEYASKDLDNLLGSLRSDKNKEGLGYNAVPPFLHKSIHLLRKIYLGQNNIDDKGYWDNGCSRHMTGNISYLSEYEPYDGGYVSFGHGGGKITDFKLKDDTNVLLRTPRQHNVYSIDLNNIVPYKNLTCLVAKALVNESMLWHRRLTWTFFLKTKDETSSILRNFITEIENLKDLKVKIIRCDNGGEFKNKEMNEFCTKKGIRREFSNARTPQQSRVAERRNRTLIEAARTMLADAKLPVTFWAEAVNTACYVQNRVLVNNLDHLEKFYAKGDEGYFVGYSISSKAFRVFNKRTKKVEENLHVDFLENKLIKKGAGPNWLFDIDTLTNSMNYVSVVVVGTSSTNISVESVNPTVSSPVLAICLDISPKSSSGLRLITKGDFSQQETLSLGNALTLSNSFEDTFGVEADLSNMETSIPVSPTLTLRIHKDHPNSQIIGPVDTPVLTRHKSKEMEKQSFIAIIHHKTNLDLLQFCLFSCFLSQEEPKKIFDALKDPSWVKALQEELLQFKIQNVWILVDCPKGEEGIDYEEVFAPVVRIEAIRLFVSYASFMGFIVYQMDVKSAFLCGTIDEEVYVMQPPGFQDPKFPNKLCREFKALMHDKFQMSVMGELTFFLGLQVLQKKDGIFLSQDKFVGDILKKFGYSDVQSMIGSLMYLTASRPDIMFAVCACARHQPTPKECHFHAVKRIFRYLKGHPKLGLWYPKESLFDLVAYSNSDYGGATQDRKSTTRGCQFLGRRLIS
uniref:Integrase catalytic domain-containing protein n=1 Tax=Tanacetum cinerariifolium TaxID=118510 RepID=A0A6L2MHF3_TANCI|nr:hypothetical protein [Tanacetum cinerariifolium]